MSMFPTDTTDGRIPGHQKLQAMPFTAMRLKGGFWAKRVEVCRKMALKVNLEQCEKTGRIDNFRKAGKLKEGEFQGIYFNDSDVYKMIEGAAYCLALKRDARVEARIDTVIDAIAAAQQPDGYLNTWYTLTDPAKRWTDLKEKHELYCAGHLLEAAVAYQQATGKDTLLQVARRLADCIDATFGAQEGKIHGFCGHEEIELALVKLSRATGEERYMKLGQYFLDARGCGCQSGGAWGAIFQDHQPVRKQRQAVGHAVRAMYLYCAMTDMAAHTGERALRQAVDGLWDNVTSAHLYITGGVGARHQGEAFGEKYELPNDSAYCETCAAVGMILWAQRLTLLKADARYADVLEKTLYNGLLAGMSLDGKKFFYVNPLASRGTHHRQQWYGCACCPPNVLRLLPTISGYAYATSARAIYVNQFMSGTAEVKLSSGKVFLEQVTQYPQEGEILLRINPEKSREPFSLHLRIPGWCRGAGLKINGKTVVLGKLERGYAVVRRQWEHGDQVQLILPMESQRVYANPRVAANRGRVALQRGPLIYCLEGVDNGGHVHDAVLPPQAVIRTINRNGLLGGVKVLEFIGLKVKSDLPDVSLYSFERNLSGKRRGQRARLRAIPYYAWDNRQSGPMAIWLAEMPEVAEPRFSI